MTWQALILFQSVLVAGSILCLRVLARDKLTAKASFAINAGLYIFLYLSFLIMLPWLGEFSTSPISSYWWRFVLGGLAFALTNVFTYKTLVYFDAAVSTLAVSGLSAIFAIIGAALVLNEHLTNTQIFGAIVLMVAIFYGVLATQYIKQKHSQRNLLLGSLYSFLAATCFALAIVNEKSLLAHMSVASYAVFGIGGQTLMSIALGLIIQPKKLALLLKRRVALWVTAAGLFRGIGGACFILSEVRSNNVGLVSVISNFKLIIVILLGWWLLKERTYPIKKLLATLLAVVGLSVMLWI
ncbi:MAG: EamA family transporter [Candidatus Saccharimonadales bacterium]